MQRLATILMKSDGFEVNTSLRTTCNAGLVGPGTHHNTLIGSWTQHTEISSGWQWAVLDKPIARDDRDVD